MEEAWCAQESARTPSMQPKPETAAAIALDCNDLILSNLTKHP